MGRLMTGKILLRKTPLELSGSVNRAVAAMRASGRFSSHEVSLDLETVWAEADEVRIEQIISNRQPQSSDERPDQKYETWPLTDGIVDLDKMKQLMPLVTAGGDVYRAQIIGYFDEEERFWFCGRKAHRVQTPAGTLFSIPCEAITNNHPRVFRSALVGIGEAPQQRPVLIVEPWPDKQPTSDDDRRQLLEEVRNLAHAHRLTNCIHDFLYHPQFPVDIRHNAKIFREKLAVWAAHQLVK